MLLARSLPRIRPLGKDVKEVSAPDDDKRVLVTWRGDDQTSPSKLVEDKAVLSSPCGGQAWQLARTSVPDPKSELRRVGVAKIYPSTCRCSQNLHQPGHYGPKFPSRRYAARPKILKCLDLYEIAAKKNLRSLARGGVSSSSCARAGPALRDALTSRWWCVCVCVLNSEILNYYGTRAAVGREVRHNSTRVAPRAIQRNLSSAPRYR